MRRHPSRLPLALSLALVSALSLPVLAAKVTDFSTPQEIPVQAQYVVDTSGSTVHSVDIEWGSMNFSYKVPGTWNPETLQYEVSSPAEGTWSFAPASPGSLAGNQIKITNRSNASVGASLLFNMDAEMASSTSSGPITGSFTRTGDPSPTDQPYFTLDAPTLVQGVPSPASETLDLTLNGQLADIGTNFLLIGKVTVTIS